MPPLNRRVALIVVVSVLLPACATPSPSATTPVESAASAVPTASEAPSDGASEGASPDSSAPPVADDPPSLALEVVAEDLESPIGITGAPGGWLLINEQRGRVVAIHPGRGERTTTLDMRDRVRGEGERGLLGLALHPDWPEVPRAFVHYSDRNGDTVLSEVPGTQNGNGAPMLDAAGERVLLQLAQPFPNHNGGQLAFGPDGYLWMGLGDGGAGGDPLGSGQDPSTLLGSILRLDVSERGAYASPPDNPFVDGGGAPEVYLYGLRNPWRFSFDTATGLLWIADVGQNGFEEIDRLDPVADAGANLGWNIMEGSHCFADPGCSADGLVLPVAEYGRDLGCSVTGGEVYRGEAVDGLGGWYLFSDYCSGDLFGVPSDAQGTALAPRILLETERSVSAFGSDESGELYVADIGGGVLARIVAGG